MSIRGKLASCVGKTSLWRLFEFKQKMPRILFYHGVIRDNYIDRRVQANQIQLSAFERQIQFLRKEFKFISLAEFYARFINNDSFSGKEVLLTFDDGYKNNLTVAYPLLSSVGVPFSVFICSDLVDIEGYVPTYYIRSAILNGGIQVLNIDRMKRQFILSNDSLKESAMNELIRCIKTYNDEDVSGIIAEIEDNLPNGKRQELNSIFSSEQLMSWHDVKALHSGGVIIGSHSKTHSILHSNQTEASVSRQLLDSKNKIIDHLGACDFFAYPNGDIKSVSDFSINEARHLYKMSFAVNGKAVCTSDDIAFISRISASFDVNSLKVQMSILS